MAWRVPGAFGLAGPQSIWPGGWPEPGAAVCEREVVDGAQHRSPCLCTCLYTCHTHVYRTCLNTCLYHIYAHVCTQFASARLWAVRNIALAAVVQNGLALQYAGSALRADVNLVLMCTCLLTCLHTCLHACLHTCLHTCLCTFLCTCLCTCLCTRLDTHRCIHMSTHMSRRSKGVPARLYANAGHAVGDAEKQYDMPSAMPRNSMICRRRCRGTV